MILPRFGLVRQLSPNPPEPHVESLLADELARTHLFAEVRPGERVLLTAGSRGINSKPKVLAGLVKALKAAGAAPFIYPAMGSHGGGTAAGQVGVLADLGITADSIGAPIYNGWDSVRIGTTEAGRPCSWTAQRLMRTEWFWSTASKSTPTTSARPNPA